MSQQKPNPNQFKNLFLPAETSGVWFWRGLMQINTCWALGPSTGINNSILNKLSLDKALYQDLNMLMVQRFVDPIKTNLFNNAFVPASEQYGFWTVYNMDDLTDYRHIPIYNKGRRAYLGEDTQENIKKTMNNADFIVTTTEFLKQSFHDSYGVPLDNIICIPNLLPRWWFGSYFNPAAKVESFRKNKNKLRIGIISSLSHYNPDEIKLDKNGLAVFKDEDESGNVVYHNERNEVVNPDECTKVETDLDTVLDVILKTVDEVQWVFFGYAPPELKEYIKERKIEVHSSIPIINYPMKLHMMNLNAVVAPLITDSKFNKSKSNIKWLEACACGIPLLAPDVVTYSPYMPRTQLYENSDELLDMIHKFSYMSATVYEKIITNQWKFLNSPFVEAGNPLTNWWLEDNLNLWLKLFKMRKKCRTASMKIYREVKQKMKKSAEESEIIFKDKDDVEVKI